MNHQDTKAPSPEEPKPGPVYTLGEAEVDGSWWGVPILVEQGLGREVIGSSNALTPQDARHQAENFVAGLRLLAAQRGIESPLPEPQLEHFSFERGEGFTARITETQAGYIRLLAAQFVELLDANGCRNYLEQGLTFPTSEHEISPSGRSGLPGVTILVTAVREGRVTPAQKAAKLEEALRELVAGVDEGPPELGEAQVAAKALLENLCASVPPVKSESEEAGTVPALQEGKN